MNQGRIESRRKNDSENFIFLLKYIMKNIFKLRLEGYGAFCYYSSLVPQVVRRNVEAKMSYNSEHQGKALGSRKALVHSANTGLVKIC